MPSVIEIDKFLNLSERIPIIDTRSPAEYQSGHMVGANNIPLFTNEERAIVGTIYKQHGREPAIKKGLEIVGPKMASFIEQAEQLNSKELRVHCWRGGMRSASMSWLFETYGFKVYTLKGGYKYFRRAVLQKLDQPLTLCVLGGKTGSGKTLTLYELEHRKFQVLDLEKLANHKGSAYGYLGEDAQPSQEQFENNMYAKLSTLDLTKSVWVEDESRLVGSKVIPKIMWENLRTADVFCVEIPMHERVKYLCEEYGKFSKQELKDATKRIEKRLGGEQTKVALAAINSGDLATACSIILVYYDKAYSYGLENRKPGNVIKVEVEKVDPKLICDQLIVTYEQYRKQHQTNTI